MLHMGLCVTTVVHSASEQGAETISGRTVEWVHVPGLRRQRVVGLSNFQQRLGWSEPPVVELTSGITVRERFLQSGWQEGTFEVP